MWAFSSLLTPTFSTLSAKLLKCTTNSLSLLLTLIITFLLIFHKCCPFLLDFIGVLFSQEPKPKSTRPRYDLCVGLNKGFKTTKNPQKPRPSRRKGVSVYRWNCLKWNCLTSFYCCVEIDQTYQIHPWHCQGSLWTCSLWKASHGIVEEFQG